MNGLYTKKGHPEKHIFRVYGHIYSYLALGQIEVRYPAATNNSALFPLNHRKFNNLIPDKKAIKRIFTLPRKYT